MRIVRKPSKSWSVLIPSHHEGYITWDQFELVSRMNTHHSQRCFSSVPGAAREACVVAVGRTVTSANKVAPITEALKPLEEHLSSKN
jgi:hypothetical protein